ncbi:MAG TPA: hypothetical protein VGM19_09335 [Armatimonadota bacterium]
MEPPMPIERLVAQIRDIVNCSEVRYRASRGFSAFAKLCTCMDTIGDTEQAIGAFTVDSRGQSYGLSYLMIYGLFQAYVIQQDAVLNLCDALREALGSPFQHRRDGYPGLNDVRALRVQIVGHPTLQGRKKKGPASYHSISRAQIGRDSITVLSEHEAGEKREFHQVFYRETTEKQAEGIASILQAVLDELRAWHDAHRAEYRESRLTSIFPEDYGDRFYDMQAAIRGEFPLSTGASSFEAVCQIMDGYEAELDRRGLAIEAYPGVQVAYEELRHPISMLRAFFEQGSMGSVCADEVAMKRAEIMTHFVEDRIAGLRDMAREIDDDYARSDVEEGRDDDADSVPPSIVVCEIDEPASWGRTGEDTLDSVTVEPPQASRLSALRYCLAKVQEGTYRDASRAYGEVSLESVRNELDQIQRVMCERGLFQEGEAAVLGKMSFPLSMLGSFYGAPGAVPAADANVYAWYLGRLVNELHALAVRAGPTPDRAP